MAQPITRFERSSNSIFVLFVSFVVAIALGQSLEVANLLLSGALACFLAA